MYYSSPSELNFRVHMEPNCENRDESNFTLNPKGFVSSPIPILFSPSEA